MNVEGLFEQHSGIDQSVIKCLPHRPPALYLEHIAQTNLTNIGGKAPEHGVEPLRLVATARISIGECNGHFPNKPRVKATDVLDAMGQAMVIFKVAARVSGELEKISMDHPKKEGWLKADEKFAIVVSLNDSILNTEGETVQVIRAEVFGRDRDQCLAWAEFYITN